MRHILLPVILILSLLLPAHSSQSQPAQITLADLERSDYRCWYPTVRGTPGYADQEMTTTRYGHFDFGAFPALEETDEWIRTIHNWGVPGKNYDVLFIPKANLSQDHRDTWWYGKHHHYNLEPDTPLCQNPDPRRL